MDLRLIYSLILAILPVSELRGGLPLAIVYATDNSIPLLLIIPLIIMANILIIFFIFYFLDNLHHVLLKSRLYSKAIEAYLKRIQKKVDKFEEKYSTGGFLALAIFVAIPLPGTGAWTGCIIAWLLDLDRKKSILSISIGVIIAGILISLGTLGVLSLFS